MPTDFARVVGDEFPDTVAAVRLFGSVARGDERGVHSDVDLLVELETADTDGTIEARLRESAYDIELDEGVPLSLIIVPSKTVRTTADHPFVQRVRRDGIALHG
ncbi:MAG: nucleotidyltransferase domain-containing protein [Natrialbaceae archaeon]|nr:nucleotidyltransferase domain-containing protein [Natrialbaceae archaeon]